jgi:hypothetical protein
VTWASYLTSLLILTWTVTYVILSSA